CGWSELRRRLLLLRERRRGLLSLELELLPRRSATEPAWSAAYVGAAFGLDGADADQRGDHDGASADDAAGEHPPRGRRRVRRDRVAVVNSVGHHIALHAVVMMRCGALGACTRSQVSTATAPTVDAITTRSGP